MYDRTAYANEAVGTIVFDSKNGQTGFFGLDTDGNWQALNSISNANVESDSTGVEGIERAAVVATGCTNVGCVTIPSKRKKRGAAARPPRRYRSA